MCPICFPWHAMHSCNQDLKLTPLLTTDVHQWLQFQPLCPLSTPWLCKVCSHTPWLPSVPKKTVGYRDITRAHWPGGHQNVIGSVWEWGPKTIYWLMCCVLCLPEAKAWLECHQHPLISYPGIAPCHVKFTVTVQFLSQRCTIQ